MQVHPMQTADRSTRWSLLEPVICAGETFPQDPAIADG